MVDLDPGSSAELRRIEHVVIVLADDCPVTDRSELVAGATACRAYHQAADGEDARAQRRRYAAALTASGYRISCDASSNDVAADLRAGALPDVTFLDVDAAGLDVVLSAWRETPQPTTLLGIVLQGGEALEVVGPDGRLGGPGTLLLVSPWSPPGWVSEEVFDHTSLLLFCERWTTARGRGVPAPVPERRRELVGDLVGALTFGDVPPELAGDPDLRIARPVPYFPVVELSADGETPRLLLGNIGPTATRPVPLVVDDGTTGHPVVAPSPIDDPVMVERPVAVRDGRYDVTVSGPQHFRRRFAGTFPSPVQCSCEHFAGGDPWFPDLLLTVSHTTTLPTFFWLTRSVGTRFGGVRSERLLGPRRTATFREEPAARTSGWYDLTVTSSADPAWVQEYAGHLHAGNRPAAAAPS